MMNLAKVIVLTNFIPLIMSSGGNSGSQASSLIIQAMALGEVAIADWWRVMRREILSGLVLGANFRTDWFYENFSVEYTNASWSYDRYLWPSLVSYCLLC